MNFRKLRRWVLSLAGILLCTNVMGQLQIPPVIYDISDGHEFVIVTKPNPERKIPAQVVLEMNLVLGGEFNPFELDTYPRWQFRSMNVAETDGTVRRYVAVYSVKANAYFSRSGHMRPASEYDKVMETDEAGKFKNKFEDIIQFFFLIEERGDNYIWLKEGKDDTSFRTCTRDIRLILVNYKK